MSEWLNSLTRLEWLGFAALFLAVVAGIVYAIGLYIDNSINRKWQRAERSLAAEELTRIPRQREGDDGA